MKKLKMIREVENDERNYKSMMKKIKYARKYRNKLISLKTWKRKYKKMYMKTLHRSNIKKTLR